MAWDVTVPDTATEAGAAANQVVANKIAKYDELAITNLLPSCHRNRRYLESLSGWQKGHINHRRT